MDKSEYIYEFGLNGKNVQHQSWAIGLDRDCLSNRKLFLSVDNLATKHNLFRVYPATSTTPLSLGIGTDLGVKLKGRPDISLDGLAPSAFMEHMPTVESLNEMCVDRAQQELRHEQMAYKLKCRKEELQRFDRTRTKWDKIYLPAEQKIDLIKQMDMFLNGSASRPQALLLKGPPGTGKTLLATILAEVLGHCNFHLATISTLKAPQLDQSANRVQQFFARARASAPAILFLDELDILTRDRAVSGNDSILQKVLGQLLQEIDGIRRAEAPIFLLAATNHAGHVDASIRSRLQETIEVPLPNKEGRARLLEIFLAGRPLDFPLADAVPQLAENCDGISGREIKTGSPAPSKGPSSGPSNKVARNIAPSHWKTSTSTLQRSCASPNAFFFCPFYFP
ncbi:MAG: ATP-binding protein [Acidobacteriaceae bacterium]